MWDFSSADALDLESSISTCLWTFPVLPSMHPSKSAGAELNSLLPYSYFCYWHWQPSSPQPHHSIATQADRLRVVLLHLSPRQTDPTPLLPPLCSLSPNPSLWSAPRLYSSGDGHSRLTGWDTDLCVSMLPLPSSWAWTQPNTVLPWPSVKASLVLLEKACIMPLRATSKEGVFAFFFLRKEGRQGLRK